MTAIRAICDYNPAGIGNGYINATSTCDCTFRVGFAGQSVQMSMDARVKIVPDQRVGA
jgi:hypothetical protein